MKIAVTGANGFIGKNLILRLKRNKSFKIFEITRKTNSKKLSAIIANSDIIYHLAGVNRPKRKSYFKRDNVNFTNVICKHLENSKQKKKIIFTSSIQANLKNEYGVSKKQSENILKKFSQLTGSYVSILRLPNIFGKFCKPNYNSVVSTFCHNINTGKNIIITNPKKRIQLLYIDDLIDKLIELIKKYC